MKDFALKVITDWLSSHKISLALIVSIWLMLSPSYNNFIQLISQVQAHEKKLEKIDLINEKINTIMIEIGIEKSKVKNIEDAFYYRRNHKEGE